MDAGYDIVSTKGKLTMFEQPGLTIKAVASVKNEQIQKELERREKQLVAKLRQLLGSLLIGKDFNQSKLKEEVLKIIQVDGSKLENFDYNYSDRTVSNFQFSHPTTIHMNAGQL